MYLLLQDNELLMFNPDDAQLRIFQDVNAQIRKHLSPLLL